MLSMRTPMLPFPPLFAGGQETLAAEQNAHPKFIKEHPTGWSWWHTPVVPALGKLRQKACLEFKAIRGHEIRLSQNIKMEKQ